MKQRRFPVWLAWRMVRTVIAWVLVAVCAVWLVVRAFGLERGYPMVPLLAYTPLAVIGAVVAAGVAFALGRRVAALAGLVVAVALAGLVAPRALGGPTQAQGGTAARLRVLTANLYQEPRAARSLAAIVRREKPDVVSVQELTPAMARELGDLLPHRVLDARRRGFGTGLYSRLPLDRRAAPRGQTVTVAEVSVRGAASPQVWAVHPRVPSRGSHMAEWRADLRALPPATDETVRILAGDFNATLDNAELRRVIGRGYHDAAEVVGAGLHPTWPAGRRFPPPVTIDHVLADERVGVRSVRVLDLAGSDHRAVLAELALPESPTAR
jgi:endonuclease/exonuclease/phosphatase (EEP) superfamily protein YafD